MCRVLRLRAVCAIAAILFGFTATLAQFDDRRISSDVWSDVLPAPLRTEAACANGGLTMVAITSCRADGSGTPIGEVHLRTFVDTVPLGPAVAGHEPDARPTGRVAVVAFGEGFLLLYNDARSDSERVSLSILDSAGSIKATGSAGRHLLSAAAAGAVGVDSSGGTIWWQTQVGSTPSVVVLRVRADGSIDGEPIVLSGRPSHAYEPVGLQGGAIVESATGATVVAMPGRRPRPGPSWLNGSAVVDDDGVVHVLSVGELRSYRSIEEAEAFDSVDVPCMEAGTAVALVVAGDSTLAAYWMTTAPSGVDAIGMSSLRARIEKNPLRLLTCDTVAADLLRCDHCISRPRVVGVGHRHGCDGSTLSFMRILRAVPDGGSQRIDTVQYSLAVWSTDSSAAGFTVDARFADCVRATPTMRREWTGRSAVDVRIGDVWFPTTVDVSRYLLRRSHAEPCLCVRGDSLLGVWRILGDPTVAGVHAIDRRTPQVDLIAATAGYSYTFTTTGQRISAPSGRAYSPIIDAACAVPGQASVSVRLSWPPNYTWDGTATTFFVSFPHSSGWGSASWGIGPIAYSFPDLIVSTPSHNPERSETSVFVRATETGRTIAQGLHVFSVDGRTIRDEPIHPDSLPDSPLAVLLFGTGRVLAATETGALYLSARGRSRITWASPARANFAHLYDQGFLRTWSSSGFYFIEVYDSTRTLRAAHQLTMDAGVRGVTVAQVPVDSGFVVFWAGAGVHGRRFTRDLEPVGDVFRVSATTGRVENPCATFVGDTAFVAWVDHRAPEPNIYMTGHRFAAITPPGDTPMTVEDPAGFSIAPLPADGHVYVTLGQPARQARLAMIDATGRVVTTAEFPPGSAILAVNTRAIAPGAYTIRVVSELGVSTGRCLVVR